MIRPFGRDTGPASFGAPALFVGTCRMPALFALLLLATPPAAAQGWAEEKCARYAQAWEQSVARFGTQGLGADFLGAHRAFIASGCRSDVRAACPRSPAEIAMADRMTLLALNAGISGTFLPFLCAR